MDLDELLKDDEKLALEMNMFVEAKKEKTDKGMKENGVYLNDRYPNLKSSQFADPEHRRFPIDTPEHCRAAMVYLNKYYNNPSKGGVTKLYSKEDFKAVHDRIVKAMKKFGIEHDGCAICKKEGKGSVEEEVVSEEVSEEQASQETESEENAENEESSEDEGKATEEVSSDGDEETSEVDEREKVIYSLREEIENLKKENEELRGTIKVFEAFGVGSERIVSLEKEGIIFEDADKEERVLKLGSMTDEEFDAYKMDLLSVKRITSSEEAEASEKQEAKASMIKYPLLLRLDYPDKQDKKEEYKKMYE